MCSTRILVATHKHYEFPKSEIYIPIQVGKSNSLLDLGITVDNTGENISAKNSSFCELTALYWAWKNHFFHTMEYVGLVHYRRYFTGHTVSIKGKYILGEEEIAKLLENADCIVPKKRNYYIETVYSHYKNAHYIQDLEQVKSIVLAKNPDYLTACSQVMNSKTLHLFNMFIMKKSLFEQYCEWLFPILFELENRIDISAYDQYQKRVFGFIAERLFNVWIVHNNIRTVQVKVVNLEKEKLYLKVFNLLKRKFLNNEKK
ncbi:TPA: DUF4422 domain-containing protein [Mannheimia haemolytica]